MSFAILREQEGRQHWIHIERLPHNCISTGTSIANIGGQRFEPPIDQLYADREAAERDAEDLQQQNARDVEATKRKRKWKTAPATYSVVPIE
jgi:hypothetical protein